MKAFEELTWFTDPTLATCGDCGTETSVYVGGLGAPLRESEQSLSSSTLRLLFVSLYRHAAEKKVRGKWFACPSCRKRLRFATWWEPEQGRVRGPICRVCLETEMIAQMSRADTGGRNTRLLLLSLSASVMQEVRAVLGSYSSYMKIRADAVEATDLF